MPAGLYIAADESWDDLMKRLLDCRDHMDGVDEGVMVALKREADYAPFCVKNLPSILVCIIFVFISVDQI